MTISQISSSEKEDVVLIGALGPEFISHFKFSSNFKQCLKAFLVYVQSNSEHFHPSNESCNFFRYHQKKSKRSLLIVN